MATNYIEIDLKLGDVGLFRIPLRHKGTKKRQTIYRKGKYSWHVADQVRKEYPDHHVLSPKHLNLNEVIRLAYKYVPVLSEIKHPKGA